MADPLKLSAAPRTHLGRGGVRKIKAEGLVPGVIYGKAVEPSNLQFNAREVTRFLSKAASENVLVDVELNGKVQLALLQEVQHHPVSRAVLHLDFHAVNENETIHAHVPLEAVGEPVGVKTSGGLLDHVLRSLDVECLPRALPAVLSVDVSGLNVGDSLHVRDLSLPEGVKALLDGGVTVFAVREAIVAVEPAATEAAAGDASKQPEVITEKKPEAGADAKAAAPAVKGGKK